MSKNYEVKVITDVNPDNGEMAISIDDKEFALVIFGKDNKDINNKFKLATNGMLIVKSFMSIKNMLENNIYNEKTFNRIANESKKKRETLANVTI